MGAVHHFPQEGGADGGDKVSIGDGGGQKVDPVVVVGLFEGVGIVFVVKGFPKLGGINPPALDFGKGGTLAVDVMDGEEGFDSEASAGGGNESGHPVIAVDDVRFNDGDDMVDDLALEGEGGGEKIAVIGTDAAIKGTVFGKMDTGVAGEGVLKGFDFRAVPFEEVSIMWDCLLYTSPSPRDRG